MLKNLLIHSNINLNNTDGASIWLSNIINVFIKDGFDIIYISNYKIINNNNLRNIENISKLNLINPEKNLSPKETLELIEKYGNQVNSILLRSELILDIINENWNLLKKTIIYGLDIHLNSIKKLNNKYNKIWTQSEKLKNLFEINGINKVNIIPVIAYNYNFNLQKRTDNEIRLIYSGTLRDEENILEIIEEFQKINKEKPDVKLTICYGKVYGTTEFMNNIKKIIKNGVKDITFKYNLSHRDCCYEISKSDIGICWRKNGWGDNGEVSTKVKEYKYYKLKILTTSIWESKLVIYKRKIKINFLYNNLISIENKLGGCFNNQINIAIFLNNYFNIYWNSIPLDNIINYENYDFNTNKIINLFDILKKEKETFNFANNIINYKKNDFDYIIYRFYNNNIFYEIAKLLPGNVIISHQYIRELWSTKNIMIGFQTETSRNYAIKKLLNKDYDIDNTLNYDNNMVIPQNSFVLYQPLKIFDSLLPKKNDNLIFTICLIGNIYGYNFPLKLFNVCDYLIDKKKIKLQIIHLASLEIKKDELKSTFKNYNVYIQKYISNLKDYYNILNNSDLCFNSWDSQISNISASNKNLDCINIQTPVILPKSIEYMNVFGKNYPLYYDILSKNSFFQIKEMIENILYNNKFKENIRKYLFNLKKNYNINIIIEYAKQL